MKHPAWKVSYARRAARLRRMLTDKALARHLGVPEKTVETWLSGRWRK